MVDFKAAYDWTLDNWEKWKLTNHKTDRGGETFAGISRKSHPEWPGWTLIDQGYLDDVVTHMLHEQLFRTNYWIPSGASFASNQRTANIIYDTAVLHGVHQAVTWLQITLNRSFNANLRVDGFVGAKTKAAITMVPPEDSFRVRNSMCAHRCRLYLNLVEDDESQVANLDGWLRRVSAL